MSELGERIRRMRQERGWSQNQLAYFVSEIGYDIPELGMLVRWHQSTASNVELGRRTPTPGDLMALAIVFRCTADEILFGERL